MTWSDRTTSCSTKSNKCEFVWKARTVTEHKPRRKVPTNLTKTRSRQVDTGRNYGGEFGGRGCDMCIWCHLSQVPTGSVELYFFHRPDSLPVYQTNSVIKPLKLPLIATVMIARHGTH